jgi:isoleucyl-tRNA synthetase
MPPLERLILHRLWQLDGHVCAAYEGYRFNDVLRPVADFCAGELSSLYFDVRKDRLYCDPPTDVRRRAARTVLHELFMRLTIWLAPLLPFTMEEAWRTRFPDAGPNAYRIIPQRVDAWENPFEAKRWTDVEAVLALVTQELETLRREKTIGSALEADPEVMAPQELLSAFEGLDPAEVFRTSAARLTCAPVAADGRSVRVKVDLAAGCKCERCWRVLPEVEREIRLCLRCEGAVTAWDDARKTQGDAP